MSSFRQLMMREKGGSNIIYAPTLDGTEQITTMSGVNGYVTPTISNNELKTQNYASGYLTEGWNNTVNWKLTFKCSSNSTSVIGGFYIVFPSTINRDYNELLFDNTLTMFIYENGSKTFDDTYFKSAYATYNTWANITVEKLSSTQLKISVGANSKTITWNSMSTQNRLCIGVDSWNSSFIGYLKDILVIKV